MQLFNPRTADRLILLLLFFLFSAAFPMDGLMELLPVATSMFADWYRAHDAGGGSTSVASCQYVTASRIYETQIWGSRKINLADVPVDKNLQPCGDAWYLPSMYTCYDTNFLCPVINGTPTLRCGPDCYLTSMYSCANGHLVQQPPSSVATTTATASSASASATCPAIVSNLHLSSPPYDNYFYSDCHASSQVVVTTPNSDSNLTLIGPRLLVAWPAGNSGVVTFFQPTNGVNGSLSLTLMNSTAGSPLGPVYKPAMQGGNATVGISGEIGFNSSAMLTVAILGSIRTIRDFTEGPSLLQPQIQSAIKYSNSSNGGVTLSRLWLDNITTTTLTFVPMNSSQQISISNTTVTFDSGNYMFNASFDYPQLTPFTTQQVLNNQSQGLITQEPTQTSALTFLSYTTKLLAGGWRFLTYFGRDSMIATLLLDPVLSVGTNSSVEAVLAAVLERINRTDGSVCHEETIGDYATWLNLQNNITSTAPQCSYIMIDSDYYLPVLMERYFVQSSAGAARASSFLGTMASIFPDNSNLTYGDLGRINAEKIMNGSAAFAAPGNQTMDNLIHLKDGQIVGEWRDSTYGIGGGRIPYDVNTALVPAALRAIAALARAGFFPTHPDWNQTADAYAQIWEDNTLQFFEVNIPIAQAQNLLSSYVTNSSFNGSDQSNSLDSDVVFHALSLDGNNNLSQVQVMNTDDCFRHFLLNTTNQTQLTSFINSTANNVRRTFPAGLMTDVSMVVANPAFGNSSVYAANWTTSAYHGTVVWSWPLAMMARGLELQLSRCSSSSAPDFCNDTTVFGNVKQAYNTLWDSIDANAAHLTTEVWSWTYSGGKFNYIDLGALPPPPGQSPTEADIVQLWSLTFLAVTRNSAFAS